MCGVCGSVTESSEVWRTESRRGDQTLAAGVGFAVGLVLAVGFRPGSWGGGDHGNRVAGFLLGLLLCLIGGALLLLDTRQAVVVDPVDRVVRIESRSRFGSKVRKIGFDEIERVYVRALAGHHGGTPAYVAARLRTGKDVAVFVGFYAGQFSRTATEERCRRLEGYLG